MSNFKRKESRQPTVYFRPPAKTKPLGIYVHIPFCQRKCNYCDFYSVCDIKQSDRYLDALVKQFEDYSGASDRYLVDTVYIGGGTPSLLKKKQLKRLFSALRKNFNISGDAEITCEVNPVSASKKMLKALKKQGVNRLSIGVQSADNGLLKTLGRLHTWEDAVSTVETARKLKFHNISVDCMYALPGQTKEIFFDTLEKIVSLGVEHLSLYSLKIEENTPFHKIKDTLVLPDEDCEIDMYFGAIDFLAKHGFHQYEISNFAKDSYECRHNLKYWNCEEYLGLGAAAASHYGNTRFTFVRDMKTYCDCVLSGTDEGLLCEEYDAPINECVGDYVMLKLRTNSGIDIKDFNMRFRGYDFEKLFGEKLAPFVEKALVVKSENGYRFNRKGFYVSNYILSTILDF